MSRINRMKVVTYTFKSSEEGIPLWVEGVELILTIDEGQDYNDRMCEYLAEFFPEWGGISPTEDKKSLGVNKYWGANNGLLTVYCVRSLFEEDEEEAGSE